MRVPTGQHSICHPFTNTFQCNFILPANNSNLIICPEYESVGGWESAIRWLVVSNFTMYDNSHMKVRRRPTRCTATTLPSFTLNSERWTDWLIHKICCYDTEHHPQEARAAACLTAFYIGVMWFWQLFRYRNNKIKMSFDAFIIRWLECCRLLACCLFTACCFAVTELVCRKETNSMNLCHFRLIISPMLDPALWGEWANESVFIGAGEIIKLHFRRIEWDSWTRKIWLCQTF